MINKLLLTSTVAAAYLLTGCGSSSDSATTTSSASTGYFVDSPVANLDYDCIVDGNSGQTSADGAFTCQNMTQVRFRLGELVLGEIQSLPADGTVFPQDIVGVPRDDVTNPQVTAMAQLLQSLDTDNDPNNGIVIAPETAETLPAGNFNAAEIQVYTDAASLTPAQVRTQAQAQEHLRSTVANMGEHTRNGENTQNTGTQNTDGTITPPQTTEASSLTQEAKDTIAYMGNEERLAYDVYMNLYNYWISNGIEIKQLVNIAQNSETKHIEAVQGLVKKYNLTPDQLTNVSNPVADMNTSIDQMPSGQYDVAEVQNLYDTLYAKGVNSAQDALEVGCMVEVTDINDLNNDIAIAEASNADDVIEVFNFLRNGSYNHYWAFDKGLKNMGVTDGCCSLGSEWCHPEYPQNENSGGNGNGNGHGNGNDRPNR